MAESTSRNKRPPFWPFAKAGGDLGYELFWIGIPAFPAPSTHRAWLMDFIARFNKAVEKEFAVRGELFLQFKTVIEVERRFRKLAMEIFPWPGLSRKPGDRPPNPPSQKQMEEILDGKPYDVRDFFPDQCFWLRADHAKLMTEFFGLGGASMFYLPPDPNAAPPKIPYLDEIKKTMPNLQLDKLEEMNRATTSLRESFLAESKKLFGEGLEDEPSWEGTSFVLPLLETKDFFTRPAEEKKKWFQLFDIFWRESPADRGLYVASKRSIEPVIIEVVESMVEAGHIHPDDKTSRSQEAGRPYPA
jgi:hypothetical protein